MTSTPIPSGSKTRILLVVLPVVLILAAAYGALSLLKTSVPPKSEGTLELKVGATLPDLEFQRLDGSKFRVSEMKFQVLLVNFWATWCEACMEEMPSLVKLHDTYRGRGLEILGVNLDEDSAKAIRSTTEEFKIGFTNTVDPENVLGTAFDVHAIPLTVTMNSKREILEIQGGDRDWMKPSYLSKVDGWLKTGP